MKNAHDTNLMLRLNLALVFALALLATACSRQSDITFFVLVKSSNYSQDSTGQLQLLNYHFFSEIFLTDSGSIEAAQLTLHHRPEEPMVYVDRGRNFYVEGGHFDTLEELDLAYPNGVFTFDINTPTVDFHDVTLSLSGPENRTDIPLPITISFFQGGESIGPVSIDPYSDLLIRWSDYSNGRDDPNGIVDDMIFVVVADCFGERIYHTGLPFEGDYMRHDVREVTVRSASLEPGRPYSAFVEFPHVVDSRVVNGVPGFTSYATATYVDLRTTGENLGAACPEVSPPMDTGQTDRIEREGAEH
jgi:hypothetical protein